tara:strand:+ start:2086 stop:2373 length:288 start_codon:yes stop_codon:yes gene_type:complete
MAAKKKMTAAEKKEFDRRMALMRRDNLRRASQPRSKAKSKTASGKTGLIVRGNPVTKGSGKPRASQSHIGRQMGSKVNAPHESTPKKKRVVRKRK